jgi:DNA-binding transcriptional LysR family regulator
MFDHINEFIVLASRLSFTTAAKELHISQPGLSRHILELEGKLGFRLINRDPVSLTTAGAYYLESVSPLLGDFERIAENARVIANKTREMIAIWYPVGVGLSTRIMIESMKHLEGQDERVSFVVNKDRRHSTLSAILDNLADIGMVYKEPDGLPEDLSCELLCKDAIRVALHKDNPLTVKQPLYFKDLSDCYLINAVNERFTDWNEGTRDACRRYGLEPRYRLKELDELLGSITQHRVDEMLITGSRDDIYKISNPNIVMRVLDDDPVCFYPIYLIYRTPAEGSFLARFIKQCHETAASYQSR